ncbi:nucleoside 2-deoxyribosyltransferase [Pediococcus claussenii]|uniref:Nucleoside 2-deoxyribosyltransferase family protein n=1 Tax=Pediococcus claussenii (strain ATCC BAA-344 / DSM 14800 / JCM 18046 / KCTC 3811 / LMG 21948 / P06) TaxID=701521 RepID=G8PD45_PEDCP|nr:nucleoside 2-deoxyribosyltransferase [Pediococcus claussenii]AEV95180.1 nucleoside 2-deoxyribosyltransferase family protein [Pediococcus claussenii ATCC BAA-344]ANZ70544.1 nucleoside 2-deoxyribosyltransferase [Pediococcus claussenii]ANZ72359.1 nucleoside 2-deoxyribosyltransferase [Pediococcus claussenii]KRN19637.1 hypothetical protein IV79_GL001354 [Pediococcus claussenii]
MTSTKSIYLAGPFFDDNQINRINQVLELLQKNDTVNSDRIFVPMQHQMESEKFGSFRWQVGVFESDIRQVRTADVVVAVLDYSKDGDEVISDPGTVFEIGMAFEHGVPVVLVQFDESKKMNLMLARSYATFFRGDGIQNLASYNFNELPSNILDVDVF